MWSFYLRLNLSAMCFFLGRSIANSRSKWWRNTAVGVIVIVIASHLVGHLLVLTVYTSCWKKKWTDSQSNGSVGRIYFQHIRNQSHRIVGIINGIIAETSEPVSQSVSKQTSGNFCCCCCHATVPNYITSGVSHSDSSVLLSFFLSLNFHRPKKAHSNDELSQCSPQRVETTMLGCVHRERRQPIQYYLDFCCFFDFASLNALVFSLFCFALLHRIL